MYKDIMRKVDFARLCGVSPSAITKAAGRSELAPAVVGRRIDAAHPAAVAYRERLSVDAPAAPGLDPLYLDAVELCQATGQCSVVMFRRELHVGHARAKRIHAQVTAGDALEAPPSTPPVEAPPQKPTGAKPQPARTRRNTGAGAARERKKVQAAEAPAPPAIPEHIEQFADMTLRDVIAQFGTDYRFRDWLEAIKSIESIQEKRIKNAKLTGELIARDLVKVGIVEPVDTALKKMLTDGSKTIARRAMAMAASGRTVDEVEYFVMDQLSSFIRPMKARMARALKADG